MAGGMTRREDLKARTKRFALAVIRFCATVPDTPECKTIRGQLVRCGSSVGANYRSACRGKSRTDFIAKLSTVEEEADESMYWLELLEDLGAGDDQERNRLINEADELVSIMVQSKKAARANIQSAGK